jgi:ketosteroid isomerase-like protein
VLNDLKRAYESKDLALVQRIRPGLRPEDLQSLRNTFDNASKYTLDLRVEAIEVRGNDAQARAFRQDVMVAKDGQIHRSEARVTVRFKRVQDRWTIDDIK